MLERQEVEKLAHLARISVPREELEAMRSELDAILEYVSQVTDASVKSPLEETKRPEIRNILRYDDNPHKPGVFSERLLAATPGRDGHLVKVKKIL